MARASKARALRGALRCDITAFVRKVFMTLEFRPSVRFELAP